jgi:hypothetical protein
MHIAHQVQLQVIGAEELAKRVGLKRRQIAELARRGKIANAIRPDGYHYVYPLTPELLDWIEWKRRQVKQRRRPIEAAKPKSTSGVITIHGIRQEFDIWFRRVGSFDEILKMESEYLQDIAGEIQPIARLHSRITQELRSRDLVKKT